MISVHVPLARRIRRPRGWLRSKRGVSDVVGTILLLALTVTLFASIFFFVNTFPRPPSQPANQFQAALVYGGANGNSIVALKITHLAGPTLTGPNILFYLFSAGNPAAFPSPYTLASGLGGVYVWNLGQTWSIDLTSKALTVPDNITVSISTTTTLLFHVTLPGSNPNIPPEFVNSGTSPLSPATRAAFTVFTQIVDDDLNSHSVYVNVSQLPGATGALVKPILMTYVGSSGLWTYVVPSGTTTTAGTYYLFVNATDLIGQANSIAIPVTIGSGSGGGGTPPSVVVSATPSTPVRGSPVNLTAFVTNPGSTGGIVNVTFSAGGVPIQTVSGTVGAGGSTSLFTTWTPSSSGVVLVSALANVSGVGTVTGTLNLTVFPKIMFVAHDVVAGTGPAVNESALLALHLTAAGVPFYQKFIACTAALPANMTSWDIVIIEFGSVNTGSCNIAIPSTAQTAIVTASASTSIWLVGSNAFSATACNSYSSAFFGVFGLGWTAGSTCTALQSSSPAAATWTGTPASGVRSDGIGSLTINATLGGSSAFAPSYSFSRPLSGGTKFLATGVGTVGVFRTAGSHRFVALATSGALIADNLPNGKAWVSGGAGSAIDYNLVNYLSGFASSSSPGRALIDYGIGGAVLVGTNHASLTNVYASLRSNGPLAGVVVATLYVNGSEAFYQGVPVSVTVSVPANGATTYVTLTWLAPGAASYTLTVVISSTPVDQFAPNNQTPLALSGQAIAFA